MLEHFLELPNIEGALVCDQHGNIISPQGIAPGSDSSPSTSSTRTLGVQVGIPAAFATIDFYRWYLDTTLAQMKLGHRTPIAVDAEYSIYAHLGHDKNDTMESATLQAMNVIVPFDTSRIMGELNDRYQQYEEKRKKVQQSQSQRRAKKLKMRSRRRQQATGADGDSSSSISTSLEDELHEQRLMEEDEDEEGEEVEQDDQVHDHEHERENTTRASDTVYQDPHSSLGVSELPPVHPLGVRRSDKIIDSRAPSRSVSTSMMDPSHHMSSSLSSRLTTSGDPIDEVRTDAALNEFIDELKHLPDPEAESEQNGTSSSSSASQTSVVPSATRATREPISEEEIAEARTAWEARKRSELEAIVRLVDRIEQSRLMKRFVQQQKREMEDYIEGKREQPSELVANVEASESATQSAETSAAVVAASPSNDAYMPHIPEMDHKDNLLNDPPSSSSGAPSDGSSSLIIHPPRVPSVIGRFSRSGVLPDSWSWSSDLTNGANAWVHVRNFGTIEKKNEEERSIISSYPVPFGKTPLTMKKPIQLGLTENINVADTYQRLNRELDTIIGTHDGGSHASAQVSVPDSSVGSVASSSNSDWLNHLRSRLWSTQADLLRRKRQLLRAMVGQEREQLIRAMGDKVIGEEDQSQQHRSQRLSRRTASPSEKKSNKYAFRSHTHQQLVVPPSSKEVALRTAFHKLEQFQQMRGDTNKIVQEGDTATNGATLHLPPVHTNQSSASDATPSSSSSLTQLERLRLHDADVRAQTERLEAAEGEDKIMPLRSIIATGKFTVPLPSSSSTSVAEPIDADTLISDWRRRESLEDDAQWHDSTMVTMTTAAGNVMIIPRPPIGASQSTTTATATAPVPPSSRPPSSGSLPPSRHRIATVGHQLRTQRRAQRQKPSQSSAT